MNVPHAIPIMVVTVSLNNTRIIPSSSTIVISSVIFWSVWMVSLILYKVHFILLINANLPEIKNDHDDKIS